MKTVRDLIRNKGGAVWAVDPILPCTIRCS